MLKLKEISVHHTPPEEKELMTMTAIFRGAGSDIRLMLRPNETLAGAWTHLEQLLRTAAIDSITPADTA